MPRGFFNHAVFFCGLPDFFVACLWKMPLSMVLTPVCCPGKPQILAQFDPVLPEHANRGTVGDSKGRFAVHIFVRSSKGQLS